MDKEEKKDIVDTSYLIKNTNKEIDKEEYDLSTFINKDRVNTQVEEDLLRFSLEEQLKELSLSNKQGE